MGRRCALLMLLVTLVAFSCGRKTRVEEEFQQEIATLQSKTTPSDARTLAHSATVRNEWSVTASWDIETNSGTAEYSKWVIGQLPEFKVVENDPARLMLSHVQDGDIYSVDCRFSSVDTKLQVRVVFSARPD
jgi:hypothetical protein